jgi:hypothetical protein
MEVYQILFLAWGIVFAMWLLSQFKQHNRRAEEQRRRAAASAPAASAAASEH